MGVDIHAVSIINGEVKEWVPTPFENGFRNTALFSFFRGHSNPISDEYDGKQYFLDDEDDGYDYTNYLTENEYYQLDLLTEDYYGAGMLTYEDLLAMQTQMKKTGMYVSEEFWETFISLGGKLPKGMTAIDAEDGEVSFSIVDAYDDGIEYWINRCIEQIEIYCENYHINPLDYAVMFNFDC